MTSAANIAGLPSGASVAPVAVSSAVSSVAADDTKPIQQPAVTSISPRLILDPSVGIITQYLNGNGQVQLQIPSSTVVAYLRAGLTAQGLAKPQNTEA